MDIENKKSDYSNGQVAPTDKKKRWGYLSILFVAGAVIFLYYLTYVKGGFDDALLTVAIVLVFPLSFRVPAIILRGLKTGMDKEWTELILLSILVVAGLAIIGGYSKDWRLVFVFPFVSLLWTIVTLIVRLIKRNLGF